MAQQAKPNNMYHCEEARPQFSRSSTFVVKTVSGNWLINDVKTSFKDFRRSSRREGAGAGQSHCLGKQIEFGDGLVISVLSYRQ